MDTKQHAARMLKKKTKYLKCRCHIILLEWETIACLAESYFSRLIQGLIEIRNNFTAYYNWSAHFMVN